MVATNQHPLIVRDETNKGVDTVLDEGDLVLIVMGIEWSDIKPPPGIFRGIEQDDGMTYVVLEVADKMVGYEVRRLGTKRSRFLVETVGHIELLARRSSASNTLFSRIGVLLARNAELTEKIEKANAALK